MPRLDDAELDHLAALARLDLDPAHRVALRGDLEKVLGYVDRLARYDDPAAAPLRHPAHDGAPLDVGSLRADVPSATDVAAASEGALAGALERLDGHVVVPRTVDADG
jgi:aspartyl-tRNA(Asn)/glutamyl-tRNA(Gln) amidotransferase subunit C